MIYSFDDFLTEAGAPNHPPKYKDKDLVFVKPLTKGLKKKGWRGSPTYLEVGEQGAILRIVKVSESYSNKKRYQYQCMPIYGNVREQEKKRTDAYGYTNTHRGNYTASANFNNIDSDVNAGEVVFPSPSFEPISDGVRQVINMGKIIGGELTYKIPKGTTYYDEEGEKDGITSESKILAVREVLFRIAQEKDRVLVHLGTSNGRRVDRISGGEFSKAFSVDDLIPIELSENFNEEVSQKISSLTGFQGQYDKEDDKLRLTYHYFDPETQYEGQFKFTSKEDMESFYAKYRALVDEAPELDAQRKFTEEGLKMRDEVNGSKSTNELSKEQILNKAVALGVDLEDFQKERRGSLATKNLGILDKKNHNYKDEESTNS